MFNSRVSPERLPSIFRKQYELCAVKPGETIAFLTDQNSDRGIIAAGIAAAAELGNPAFEICVGEGPDQEYMGSNPLDSPALIEAMKHVDLVITFFVSFFSGWEAAVRATGGRILNLLETPDQLVRLQSSPELKRAVIAARDRLARTNKVRVTSDAGTDFSWDRDTEIPLVVHYGAVDEPGQMDQWGQGMVAMHPVEGSANGRVVVTPGDVWILPYARMVQSVIDLEVRDGFIRRVTGGADAKIFKYWLDSCRTSSEDLDPYAISHLGWGLNPKARWDDIVRYENRIENLQASMRSFPGSFLFSTGPSPHRKTRGHIDMPMCDCTVALDDEVIIERGRLVDPAMIVDPDRTYH
jgi:2,5-dihydroxypyridine 5,6-dioxygenase